MRITRTTSQGLGVLCTSLALLALLAESADAGKPRAGGGVGGCVGKNPRGGGGGKVAGGKQGPGGCLGQGKRGPAGGKVAQRRGGKQGPGGCVGQRKGGKGQAGMGRPQKGQGPGGCVGKQGKGGGKNGGAVGRGQQQCGQAACGGGKGPGGRVGKGCKQAGKPGQPPRGNNGVGNGRDPQPPGNPPVNDGANAGPGQPGNRGGAFRIAQVGGKAGKKVPPGLMKKK